MLGLRGNNVKLALKPVPDSPARKKATSSSSSTNARAKTSTVEGAVGLDNAAVDSTDSDSGVGLRSGRSRIGSASTSALSSRVFPVQRLAARKLSEPAIKIRLSSSATTAGGDTEKSDCPKPRRRFSMSNEANSTRTAAAKPEAKVEVEPPSRERGSVSASATPSVSVDLETEPDVVVFNENDNVSTPSPDNDSDQEPEVPAIAISIAEEGKEHSAYAYAYDQMLLEESDNLIQDVVAMCSEMGIDSSGIVRQKTAKHVTIVSPTSTSTSSSTTAEWAESPAFEFMDCKVIKDSKAETEFHGRPDATNADKNANANTSMSESVASTYERIMSTLAHIEEEERQQESYPKSKSQSDSDSEFESAAFLPPPRSSSVASCTCTCSSPGPSAREGEGGNAQALVTEKSRSIYSFLDQVEKSDRDVLFSLKFTENGRQGQIRDFEPPGHIKSSVPGEELNLDFDSLVRKGAVELSKEFLLLRRKYEDTLHTVRGLEQTLLSQRELNMRNLRTAEQDLQKRIRLQKEEFELALSRHQTFVDQLLAEKRALQNGAEKALASARDAEQKHAATVRALQEKHAEELRHLRRAREESARAQRMQRVQWASSKTAEIQNNTVKGLAPEVQRLITRHQQEMAETRAWHADELKAVEERYARRQEAQVAEMREAIAREKDDAARRLHAELDGRLEEERRRWREAADAERAAALSAHEHAANAWAAEKASIQAEAADAVRRAEARAEAELETAAAEHMRALQALATRHSEELRAMNDVHTAECASRTQAEVARAETALLEQEARLRAAADEQRAAAVADTERRLRDEFKRLRTDDEDASDARCKRLASKLKAEIAELEASEGSLKQRLAALKAELASMQDNTASLQAALAAKERQATELNESNMKMVQERVNLTSVIRREFAAQIEELEADSRAIKASVVELKTKHRLEIEAKGAEAGRALALKDEELERVAARVKQTLERKEETLEELRRQLELSRERVRSLEQLLEEQRREFLGELVAGAGERREVGAGAVRGRGRGRK